MYVVPVAMQPNAIMISALIRIQICANRWIVVSFQSKNHLIYAIKFLNTLNVLLIIAWMNLIFALSLSIPLPSMENIAAKNADVINKYFYSLSSSF